MSKQYQLSITKDYCHDWTVTNALRELFQNQLDSPAEGSHDFSDGLLSITSYNVFIPAKTLLMGVTSKRSDDDSVGGKGEGFKLACAILLREGCNVEIHNGSVKWVPSFKYDPTYGVEVLVFEEYPLAGNKDLVFFVEGVSEDDWYTTRQENLYLRDDVGDTDSCEYGTLIRGFGGKVFVGGLYVCDEPRLSYSYDFHPSVLRLNRDRKSVDDWDLRMNTSKLLCEVLELEEVADLLSVRTYDINNAQYLTGDGSIASACYEKLKKDTGGEPTVLVEREDEKAAASGMYKAKPMIHPSGPFTSIIQGCAEYKEDLKSWKKEEYEEDTREPLDIFQLLEPLIEDNGDEALIKMYGQIKQVFEDKGVDWYDTTHPIPF